MADFGLIKKQESEINLKKVKKLKGRFLQIFTSFYKFLQGDLGLIFKKNGRGREEILIGE